MKAVIYDPSVGITVKNINKPKVPPKHVLVNIKAAGICASDLHYILGHFSYAKTPIIPGHEGSGVVEEVGSDVERVSIGDRVVIDYIIPCGKCRYCQSNMENICPNLKCIGFELDGTFAEYVVVPEDNLIKLPENIPFEIGAIAGCAVVTPYHAIRISGLNKGESIAVMGLGGVGIHAITIAKLKGANPIIGIDIDDYKLSVAKEYGADYVINASKEDPVEKVRSITEDGVDYAFEFIGLEKTVKQVVEMVRRGGKVVLVGLVHKPVELNIPEILHTEKKIYTSIEHTKQDLRDIIKILGEEKLDISKSITHEIFIDEIQNAIEILRDKKETAIRIVINRF